jgi:hypothetical protein
VHNNHQQQQQGSQQQQRTAHYTSALVRSLVGPDPNADSDDIPSIHLDDCCSVHSSSSSRDGDNCSDVSSDVSDDVFEDTPRRRKRARDAPKAVAHTSAEAALSYDELIALPAPSEAEIDSRLLSSEQWLRRVTSTDALYWVHTDTGETRHTAPTEVRVVLLITHVY